MKTLAEAHERFITCLRWAPGIVKDASAGSGNASDKNSKNKTPFPDVQVRCVIATAGVDWKLKVFAN